MMEITEIQHKGKRFRFGKLASDSSVVKVRRMRGTLGKEGEDYIMVHGGIYLSDPVFKEIRKKSKKKLDK